MPHIETTDLSFIADRVQPQTWTLFQVLRTRMRQMKGVTMKVQYEKHTREPIPAFYYGSRQLFHVHARGEEISATLHTDQKARTKIAEDQSVYLQIDPVTFPVVQRGRAGGPLIGGGFGLFSPDSEL